MEYEYLYYKVKALCRMVPLLTEMQLIKFFDDDAGEKTMKRLIDDFLAAGILRTSQVYEKYTVLSLQDIKKYTDAQKMDYINAFWPIAWMHSKKIRWISTSNGPTKYMLVAEDSFKALDISICESAEEARAAAAFRDVPPGSREKDDIVHIAICSGAEAAEKMCGELADYNFDYYCLLDRRHHFRPEYYQLG